MYNEYKQMDTKIITKREQLTPVETKTSKRGKKAPSKHLDALRESVERNLQKRNKKVRRYMQHYKPARNVEEQYQRKNQALKETVSKKEISVDEANMLIF